MPTVTSRARERSWAVLRPAGRLAGWVAVLCCLAPGAARPGFAADSQVKNWDRLRSMPREERLVLSEKLKQFDALGRSDQAAIRALDDRISKLPDADRANYESVLRRYHQWVLGLTEDQRNELKALPASERMRLVTKLRAEDRTNSNGTSTPLFLQVIDFSSIAPYEAAHRLKAWFELGPEKRAEIEKLGVPAEQQKRLVEIGQHLKAGGVGRFNKGEEDSLFEKMESNSRLNSWLAYSLKKADPAKHEKVKRRMAMNYHFLEHPPAPVDTEHLLRFATELPSWYREPFDPLPSDEARRRLTILYRLVFPAPEEMPAPRKPAPVQRTAPAPAAARPSATPSKPSGPPAAPAAGANPF
jgi:hypothetical protein